MSTRSVIARPLGDGIHWEGRYHHWDGYPSGVGRTLWALAHGPYAGDFPLLVWTLLDDHPAGWSTINVPMERWQAVRDGAAEIGYLTRSPEDERLSRPQCYCHGDRHEEAEGFIEGPLNDVMLEWTYVLDPTRDTLTVYRGCGECEDDQRHTFPLSGPEPDWVALDGRG